MFYLPQNLSLSLSLSHIALPFIATYTTKHNQLHICPHHHWSPTQPPIPQNVEEGLLLILIVLWTLVKQRVCWRDLNVGVNMKLRIEITNLLTILKDIWIEFCYFSLKKKNIWWFIVFFFFFENQLRRYVA